MSAKTTIAFLDDDPVLRIARYALSDRLQDPWIGAFFAPERPDLDGLASAARVLRTTHGSIVFLASEYQRPVEGANVIIFRRGIVNATVLDANPELRLVQRFGERPDGIDLVATTARNVPVSCLPRRTLHYTAEHAMLLMLALAKRLLPSDRAVRCGLFDAASIMPIESVAYNWVGMSDASGVYGKTLGIIGLGEIGTMVARLANAFGMRVLYHNRRRASVEVEQALNVTYVGLPNLLEQSDFVSLHATNTSENESFADTAFFKAMKRGSIFVNTTRGRLVDEDALYHALTREALAGAGLDVHRVEPRAGGDRFALLPNVVLTPHLAGGARSGVLPELTTILSNCDAAMRGAAPQFAVVACNT